MNNKRQEKQMYDLIVWTMCQADTKFWTQKQKTATRLIRAEQGLYLS